MGVFDQITISSSAATVTLQRPVGPLERGYFSPTGSGTWVPDLVLQALNVEGFGVDATGYAYYDTLNVTTGNAVDLWVDPSATKVWLA